MVVCTPEVVLMSRWFSVARRGVPWRAVEFVEFVEGAAPSLDMHCCGTQAAHVNCHARALVCLRVSTWMHPDVFPVRLVATRFPLYLAGPRCGVGFGRVK